MCLFGNMFYKALKVVLYFVFVIATVLHGCRSCVRGSLVCLAGVLPSVKCCSSCVVRCCNVSHGLWLVVRVSRVVWCV